MHKQENLADSQTYKKENMFQVVYTFPISLQENANIALWKITIEIAFHDQYRPKKISRMHIWCVPRFMVLPIQAKTYFTENDWN